MAEPDLVVLRPGTVDDIPGLRALGEAVVPVTYGPIDAAYAPKMLDEWWTPEVFAMSLQRNAHVVAERDGQVVAVANLGRLTASYRDFPDISGEREVMWKLYVHPDHQGLGIGRRLLEEVEQLVEGEELWLEVVDGNDRAVGFYEAHGFAEVERAPGTVWPDDIWFRKQLTREPTR